MNKSEAINELAAALAKAQAKIKGVLKDTANPFFKSKYADLAACWEMAREPLASNGLSVIQLPSTDDVKVMLETVLAHSSGQWVSATVGVKPLKYDAQGLGSALTYLRRYSLCAVVGIAQEDDDGNAATKGRSTPEGDHHHEKAEDFATPFNPKDEAHKAWLRKELNSRKVTGPLALAVLDAMAGKFEDDLEAMIRLAASRLPSCLT